MPGPQVVVLVLTSKPGLRDRGHLQALLDDHRGTAEAHLEVLLIGWCHVVHRREVRSVDDVLGQVLDMDAHPVGVAPPRRPLRLVLPVADHLVARRRRLVRGARRRCARCARTPSHARAAARGGAVESRHLDQLAVAVEAPTVERAGDAVTAHTTPDAQVGTEVGTVGIEDPGASVLAPEEHQVAAQVAHRPSRPRGRGPRWRRSQNQPLGEAGNG